MGWASGSDLYDYVIRALRGEGVDAPTRRRIHTRLIKGFESHDWDTQDECMGTDTEFDLALLALHPEWDDEDY